MADRKFGIETLTLHAGQVPDPATGARAVPIHLSTSFVFESSDHAAALFNLSLLQAERGDVATSATLRERAFALAPDLRPDATETP